MTTQPGRVHVYCRVSSAGQEDGYSLDTQESACRKWADERGYPIASVAHEVRSGGDRNRPKLDRIIDALAPGDVVLAYALDRFSRSQAHIGGFLDHIDRAGATLQLVSEDFENSSTGRFIRGAKAFAAELELEKIRERTQRGRRARVQSGKPIAGGKPCYGYLWADAEKSRLELDPDTAPIVRQIFDMALDGVTLRGIATRLQERGIPSPGGNVHWRPAGIRDLLLCPTYTGDAVAYRQRWDRKPNGGYAPRPGTESEMVTLAGIAPAIASPEELATIAARLESNKANSNRNNATPEAALLRAGYIRCGQCGRSLGVQNTPKKRPGTAATYRECATPGCQRSTIAVSVIDAAVWDRVCKILRSPNVIAEQLDKHRDNGGYERDIAAIDKRLERNATQQTNLARALAAVDNPDPIVVQMNALSAAKKTLDADREALMRRMADAAADAEKVRTLTDWCRHVAVKLDSAGYQDKRTALEALGVSVRVWGKGATDDAGEPLPRWVLTMRPLALGNPIVYARAGTVDSPRSQ